MYNPKLVEGIVSDYLTKFPEWTRKEIDIEYLEDRVRISFEGDVHCLRVVNVIVNVLLKHVVVQEGDKFFIFDLCLALEEAILNVYNHSYPDNQGKIELEIAFEDSRIVIRIIDFGENGASFDVAEKISLSAPKDKFAMRGRGLLLIKKAVDSIDYQSTDGKNILTLIKNRGA